MSGAEAFAVLGLISSIITIIETSRDLYDAATSAKGLHEAFRAVAQNIPLVLNILRDCKRIQEQADRDYDASNDPVYKHDLEESAKAVKPIMLACEENAQKLKAIFEKVIPGDRANWLERYRKAAKAVMPNKKHRVEDLMEEILQSLQLLHTNQFFKVESEKKSEELDMACQQLSELPPSLPDDDTRNTHHGSGSINFHAGTGVQNNYNQSGGSNNKQYNAGTLNIHET